MAERSPVSGSERPSGGQFPGLPGNWPPLTGGSGARDLAHLEGLDDVADLDVLEVPEHQTTLEALADLGRVVLLPLERGQVEVVGDHGTVAQHPGLGVAPDDPAGDHATRDVADLGRAEDLTDLRLPESRLLEDRLE